MQEIHLHSWGDSLLRGGSTSCRSKNYNNHYDDEQRERYSARGQGRIGHGGQKPFAVEILNDPMSREDGGFSSGARFRRKDFKVMMERGVLTEGTIVMVDKCKWTIIRNKGCKSQRKVKIKDEIQKDGEVSGL